MSWLNELLNKKMLFADGAMGTMLQADGLPEGYPPDLWVLENPDAVERIHASYINAGCNIITTNTFGANRLKLKKYGVSVSEVAEKAVGIAKKAIEKSGRTDVFTAIDIGPTGKLLSPLGDLDFEDAVSCFSETIKAGAEAGADLVLIETMSDTYEIKAAVLAAKESCNLPVICTMVFSENGKLLTGGDLNTACAMLEGLGVDAIGFNCGLGPKAMIPLVKELKNIASVPIIVSPNAGLPKTENGKTYFDVSPSEFADEMLEISEYASIMGGCCGTTPEHIGAMINVCKDVIPSECEEHNDLRVTSYSQCVSIGSKPVIIGERINPTGKKLFKQALRDGDTDYILKEAVSQEEKGAHILDVNVGLPEINEPEVLENAVKSIQCVTRLPLQIDTSDTDAMEKALRIYNGKPLVNSVNGKEESLSSVLPLVKKYGGAVVGLTLDENGIPDTAEGRYEIAERIVSRAEAIGIKRRDIIIDSLTLPVSADGKAAETTLKALKMISEKLNVKTVLGVSNVSFGLPNRANINSAFFALALENGLSAGIVNPCSEDMMRIYYSFCALKGFDLNCEEYIKNCSGVQTSVSDTKTEMTLQEAVIKGFSDKAYELADSMAKNENPLDVINSQLVPALDTVGEGFEKGTVYLPQLLMSAEAAKSAFDALKKYIGKADSTGEKVIVATVHGDIHDIGKNIVRVLLENYRFEVIDLGKDVPAQAIADAVVSKNIKLVGLSALMTTTVPAMEETIKLLREVAPETKIVVGGAVLTQEYADMIGADFYAKDAMETVRYAQKLFE